MENAGEEIHPPIMSPIAVVNNHHFWGTIEYVGEVGVAPVGEGEYRALWSQASSGICPDSLGHGYSTGQGLCPGTACKAAGNDAHGLEDGAKPDVAFRPTFAAPDADHIATELELCGLGGMGALEYAKCTLAPGHGACAACPSGCADRNEYGHHIRAASGGHYGVGL